VVTIGYSDNDELKTCTDTTLIPLTWETVSTFDNGQNWSNSSKVFHTDNFLSCPFGRLQNGNRAFDFLRANDGTYYFVAGDWASDGGAGGLHLFSSSSSSVIVNNTGSGTPTNFVWREWCPGFLDAPDGSAPDAGPATNWSPPGVPCPSGALATHQSYLLPTLVSDGTDRVGLLFYQGPNISLIRPVFEENLTPRLPSGSWQGITLAGSLSSPSGSVLLQHLSAVSSSPQAAEGCTAPGSFYAFFLTADGTTPTLRSTSIIP